MCMLCVMEEIFALYPGCPCHLLVIPSCDLLWPVESRALLLEAGDPAPFLTISIMVCSG